MSKKQKEPKAPAKYTYTADQIAQQRAATYKKGYDTGYEDMRKRTKKVINEEISKKIDEWCRLYDSHVLWVLHAQYGWGKKRLEEFVRAFGREHRELKRRYEMDDPAGYVAVEGLKEIGLDLDKLYKEIDDDGNHD